MIKKLIISMLSVFCMVIPAKAQSFFDTSDASQFVTFGGRIGLNTSNRSFASGNYTNMVMTTWGTGFNLGAVANINFKEYLSLQPGIFFESRSGNLINIANYIDYLDQPQTYYAKAHLRAYYFTIPVLGVVKFNITDKIKWMVDFGPYVQFSLKQTGQNDVQLVQWIIDNGGNNALQEVTKAKHKGYDVGLKMGTGLRLFSHYYIGVHYLAGLCNAWNYPNGGKNKSWEFSVGYDF